MLIDVSKIIAKPNGSYNEMLACDMKEISYNGLAYEISKCEPVEVKINVTGNRKASIYLKTTITLLIPCDRCLAPVEISFDVEYSREVDFNEDSNDRIDNMDELNFINGTDFDVDKLICDEIIIDFPLQVLCKDDCAGLCKVCGCNLNNTTCDCDRADKDIRMSVISDIFKNFKEV